MKLFGGYSINEKSHLTIDGVDLVDIANKYGTPLYVLSQKTIEENARSMIDAINTYGNGLVCYASKALSCKAIYSIINELGMGVDVVSGGELYTALEAGTNPDLISFHGNNKSLQEIEYAVSAGVHALAIDGEDEPELIDACAKKLGKKQGVLVRVNPGVEAHTHEYVQTAKVDSKFGFSISDGSAQSIIERIVKCDNLRFLGINSHIGSQIFETEPFVIAIRKQCDFIAQLNKIGVTVDEITVGGGYGVHYTPLDKPLKPRDYVLSIIDALKECVRSKGIKAPKLIIEPGRSIVGEAGVTLYSVGATKNIAGIKKYVAVDGGMFDNPRYALYKSEYACVLANRANDAVAETVTISGKCCESGDILIENAKLPVAKRGDILAILSTGAYNYSMASNYNRNLVPPMILVNGADSDYIVKPQTYEDLIRNDCIPDWLKGKKG